LGQFEGQVNVFTAFEALAKSEPRAQFVRKDVLLCRVVHFRAGTEAVGRRNLTSTM
jgi:hypothetical protein